MTELENLLSLLEKGQDNALIRFALGNALIKEKNYSEAAKHLAKTVEFGPQYSAAWKLYGQALTKTNELENAVVAYEKGIASANEKGDIQAAKEMQVFLNRLTSSKH